LFALAVTLLSGFVAGLAPALRGSRSDFAASGAGSRAAGSGPSSTRFASILVASEIALATVLLLGAGLMVGSFRSSVNTGAGLDPDSLLTLRLSLSDGSYP